MAASNVATSAEALFDEIATSYEDSYSGNAGLNHALDKLSDGALGRWSSILDLGCGAGGPASKLIQAGFYVTGIDVSQNMIDLCRKSLSGDFIKADMREFEPNRRFDAVVALFSLLQEPNNVINSIIFKMASWLRRDGTIVLGVVVAEDYVKEEETMDSADYVENFGLEFMGRVVSCTLISTSGWLRRLQAAGLFIQDVHRHTFSPRGYNYDEKQVFITVKRCNLEPLFGPYPLPARRCAPHRLSEAAWKPLAERFVRHDIDAVLNALGRNKRVLDVGSGHGDLAVAIAKQCGEAYAVEPNRDRQDVLIRNSGQSNVQVHVRQGTAEKLPFEDNQFDAVVALWLLHYVDDPETALAEMARVVDRAAPNARIVIVQGAPDNSLVNLVNSVCGPIAQQSMAPGDSATDHQGLLLATAADVLAARGFGAIEVRRVHAHFSFPEEDLAVRCERAAALLTDVWYADHDRADEMRAAFLPVLEEHFSTGPWQVDDQAVMLIATPVVVNKVRLGRGSPN